MEKRTPNKSKGSNRTGQRSASKNYSSNSTSRNSRFSDNKSRHADKPNEYRKNRDENSGYIKKESYSSENTDAPKRRKRLGSDSQSDYRPSWQNKESRYSKDRSSKRHDDNSNSERRSFSRDNDRGGSENRENRFNRGSNDRPQYNKRRDDNSNSERRSFSRDNDRGGSENRFSRGGNDRPQYNKRHDDNSNSERRSFSRDNDRGGSENRENRFSRGGNDRPQYNKRHDDNSNSERRSFSRDNDRGGSENRENRFSRGDNDRPQYNKRHDDNSNSERRSFSRDNDRGGSENRENRFGRGGNDRPQYNKRHDDNFNSERRPFSRDNDRGGSESRENRFGSERPVRRENFNKNSERPYNKTENGGSRLVRLNKFISNAGICSRREADVLIESGAVSVNGVIVTEMGLKVSPTDNVNYGGERLVSEKKVYLLLNKPKDFITTLDDPMERKTVMQLINGACKERVYPVGRLDRNTTGLLLFTNDGEMAKKLTHPSHGARKVYHVELDKPVTNNDMKQILEGVELEDGIVKADDVQYADESDKRMVGIELHSGKNRIVRRVFEHLGYDVQKLDRIVFTSLTKKDLPRGKYRFLTNKEIDFLKMV